MEKQKKVLAVSDISCVGRCSLTVALPVLSAAGFDTGILPIAVLSTHTGGFTGFTYRDLTEDIDHIIEHWNSLNLRFDALYSGFLGSAEQIDKICALYDSYADQDSLIMVDPAMADEGELYSIFTPEIITAMAKLCAKADIIVPNMTEAAFILGEAYVGDQYDQNYIERTLKKLADLGPNTVVLTGVSLKEGQLGAAAYDKTNDMVHYAFQGRVNGYFHGTGDVFSSALLAALLNGLPLQEALQLTVDYTHRAIEITQKAEEAWNLERRYGPLFEKALPYLIQRLGLK